MRRMLAVLAVLLVLACGGAVAYLATNPRPSNGREPYAHAATGGEDFAAVERGRYLVTVADCAACHTDPKDGRPFAGGRRIETPFGPVAAPNITPDRETGIGTWTDDDLVRALHRGVGKDGRMIYPAMPFPYNTRMSRDDVEAMMAYLRTVAPASHRVQTNLLPFPFNIRLGMRVWDALYLTDARFRPDPSRDAVWNRGAYLVQGPEHCGACHTPKTWLGGDKAVEAFQGNVVQGWFAPDITNDARRGLGSWSTGDVVQYLKTGHNRQAASSGPMAEEVGYSSARMSTDDLLAIATYLKSLPGQDDGGAPLDPNDPRMVAGAAIYADACAACHRRDGAGVGGLFPTLRNAPFVQSRDATSLIRVVLQGAKSIATDGAPTGAAMPSFSWQLGDDQVAAVLTYVRNAWGNQAPAVSPADVAAPRARLARHGD